MMAASRAGSIDGRRLDDFRIAIDGPGAAGKSTVSQRLAERLGYRHFDTGLLYRTLTLLALRRQVDPGDAGALAQLAAAMPVEVQRPQVADGRSCSVLLAGEDITWALHSPEVDRDVSQVSAHPEVRAALLEPQRRIAAGGAIAVVGRDIGTVVLPDADLKVYLTASTEERAHRRHDERLARGEPSTYATVLAELRRRDEHDSGRGAAPLRPAPDAVVMDTTGHSVDEVVALVMQQVQERLHEAGGQAPTESSHLASTTSEAQHG